MRPGSVSPMSAQGILTIERLRRYTAFAQPFKVLVDGVEVGAVKNGTPRRSTSRRVTTRCRSRSRSRRARPSTSMSRRRCRRVDVRPTRESLHCALLHDVLAQEVPASRSGVAGRAVRSLRERRIWCAGKSGRQGAPDDPWRDRSPPARVAPACPSSVPHGPSRPALAAVTIGASHRRTGVDRLRRRRDARRGRLDHPGRALPDWLSRQRDRADRVEHVALRVITAGLVVVGLATTAVCIFHLVDRHGAEQSDAGTAIAFGVARRAHRARVAESAGSPGASRAGDCSPTATSRRWAPSSLPSR